MPVLVSPAKLRLTRGSLPFNIFSLTFGRICRLQSQSRARESTALRGVLRAPNPEALTMESNGFLIRGSGVRFPPGRVQLDQRRRAAAIFLAKRFLVFGLTTLIACLFPVRRANLGNRTIGRRGFRMIRPVCFRQGKDFAKDLRQTLRSVFLDSHQFADVANVKLCLLLRFSFRLMFTPLQRGSIPVQGAR
jgi:hypothetical protein